MIISHKYKYIFIGLPFSGSSAISKELIELYDGESIFMKHTNIQAILNTKKIDISKYFVFAVYRDPLDITRTTYSKYLNNAKGVYTDKNFLKENGGHVSKKAVKWYNYIQSNKITFQEYIKYKYRGFIPFDFVFSINEKYLNFQINFESLNEDFKFALLKIGIQPKRDLPIYNKTENKIDIDDSIRHIVFEPYYLRRENVFETLKRFEIRIFLMQLLYHVAHPIRKNKWLKMDKYRTDKMDEYFSKINS
jgi:hypothetical protein